MIFAEDSAPPSTTLPIRIDYTRDTHALRHATLVGIGAEDRGNRVQITEIAGERAQSPLPGLAGQFA
jgi:hypothetical protein